MRIGLKLWSTNVGDYLREARRLYAASVFDYIELFVVPGTESLLDIWRRLRGDMGVSFVIHNAHAAQGFNLADRAAERVNREIYLQSRKFADALEAEAVVFHAGMDGSAEETVRQLKSYGEPRAVVENKPFVPLPNRLGFKSCRGATGDEIGYLLAEAGCGFCLDVGHAFGSACSQGLDGFVFVGELYRRFRPRMFHLSDVADVASPYDSHLHLGEGALDFHQLMKVLPLGDEMVLLETRKSFPDRLDDFPADVEMLRRFYG